MYIPEFWVGVISTLLSEAVIITILVFTSAKGRDEDENYSDKSDE